MNFNAIVCIKQVPGTIEVKIDPKTNTLIREGIENIINPFDMYAIEEGVRIKERLKTSFPDLKVNVIAMTMGPTQAEKILRDAISSGVDKSILLSDKAFAGADTLVTANTIASAITKIGDFKIIICGKQTIDGDTGQVGPELAKCLGIPFVGYVSEISYLDDSKINVKQLKDKKYELLEVNLPVVLSVLKEINNPRIPSLRNMMKAKSEIIEKWGLGELGLDENEVGLQGSKTRVIKIFKPEVKTETKIIEGDPDKQVDELYYELKKYCKV